MGSKKGMTRALATGVLGMVVATGASAADTKWYDAIAIGGHVQGSYVGNFSKYTPAKNEGRVYDARNGFNINQAQLRIAKPLGDDGYGFGVKLLAGHDAGLIHSTGLGSTNDFDLQEAYVTMAVPKAKGLTFTGGKFVTSCGVEVIESPLNLMVSPGYLFFYGMPFTHTGAKLGYTLSDKVSFMAGLVNGWDIVEDNNSGKTAIWQIATTPAKGLTANLSGSYGPELLSDNNTSKRTHLDFVLGYTGIDKLSLSAEALWGQDSNSGGTDNTPTNHWTGYGVWAGYAVNSVINPGVRFEIFDDQNGAGRFSGYTAPPVNAGLPQTVKNLTINNKFITSANTFIRAEYRHDFSNEAAFTRSDGSAVKNQNTYAFDWVVTF